MRPALSSLVRRPACLLGALTTLLGVACSDDPSRSSESDLASPDVADVQIDVEEASDAADAADASAVLAEATVTDEQEAAILTLSATTMRDDVDFLASDELGGRIPGSPGHREAREFIAGRMQEIGLVPFGDDGGFVHEYATNRPADRDLMFDEEGNIVQRPDVDTGYNVVGLVPGSDPALADEYMVLMAHYDHLGVQEDGDVFNGALDNATGVALALEVARVLLEPGAAPGRSLVILITDEEEGGLNGAEMWIADPPVPSESIVLGVSADPLGRRILPDYGVLLLAGFERSPALQEFWRQTADFAESDVIFVHRNAIPIFASDQDEFHGADIPVPAAWFINPGMSFYHTPDDEAETIDYRILLDSAQYMARSLAFAGSTSERWDYLGEPPLAGAAAADLRVLLVGLLTSEELTESERSRVNRIIGEVDEIIETDSTDVVEPVQLWLVETVGFIAFELPREHPGQVPPPFPG